MRPAHVNERNQHIVLQRIKNTAVPVVKRPPKFTEGDRVRISKHKMTFSKGYTPNCNNEIFTVYHVRSTTRPVTYLLKDHRGEVLKGGFYDHEISQTTAGDVYLVEKILQRKGDRVRVRVLGFDGAHDSWIRKRDLV